MNQQAPILDEESVVAQQKKRKEQLTRSMVLNGFVVTVCLVLGMTFILPQYEEIELQVNQANALITSINTHKNDGMTVGEFTTALASAGKAAKNPIFADKEKVAEAMAKDPKHTGTYYEWLNQEVGKESLGRYDQMIAAKREIIGNVIPTFTETLPGGDADFDKDRITMASFIKHVEENIFKQFKVNTYGQLGIDKVNFDNSKNSIVNIGTFKVDFQIEGQNYQLLKLIQYIQDSGKVKVENGKLVSLAPISKNKKDPSLSELNNLLMTIENLEAESSFEDPELKNRVNLSLSFYVKGRTYASLIEIRSMVSKKVSTLKSEIESLAKSCSGKKTAMCESDAGVTAISALRSLVSEATALDTRSQEMVKAATVADLGAEFDKVFAIYATARTIETGYLKQKAILERPVKAAPAPKNSK